MTSDGTETAKLRLSSLSSLPAYQAPAEAHMVNTSSPQWFALRTRSRHEKMVRDRLEGNGFEPFLPLVKTLRRWSDRKMRTEVPLFSCYCFGRFPLRARLDILNIPGIVNIVGIVGPQPIPQEEMDALKIVASSQRDCDSHNYLAEGTWVKVVRGPLAGIRGQLVRKAKQDCVVIHVRLLHQAVAVHIDVSEVTPVL